VSICVHVYFVILNSDCYRQQLASEIWVWILCLCNESWWLFFYFYVTLCGWYVDCWYSFVKHKWFGSCQKDYWMEIHENKRSKRLWLSQQGYIEKVLDRFGMSYAKSVNIPLRNNFKLYVKQCSEIDAKV